MFENLAQQLKTLIAQYVSEGVVATYTRLGHVPKVVNVFIARDRSSVRLVGDISQTPTIVICAPADFPLGPPQTGDQFSVDLPGGVRERLVVTKPADVKTLGNVVLQYRVEVEG